MLNIKLIGFEKDNVSHQEIDGGRGWIEWRTLHLDYEGVNPEWFLVAACNQYYYDKEVAPNADNLQGYFIQEKFNESQLLTSARSVYDKLQFKDWDDFYDKMNKYFLYED